LLAAFDVDKWMWINGTPFPSTITVDEWVPLLKGGGPLRESQSECEDYYQKSTGKTVLVFSADLTRFSLILTAVVPSKL
jgi:hypothetical protein